MVIFYAVFGPIAERQYFAPLKMSKYSIALSNIGRLDYMGALLFSGVSVFSLTFPLMLSSLCLKKVFGPKKEFVIPLIVCAVQGTFTYFFQSDLFPLVKFFTRYVSVFYAVISYLLPTVILIIALLKKSTYKAKKGALNV